MRISDWSSDVCSSDLGGESIPFATLAAATDAFGPILAQNYGLTEAMMTCTHLPPREHLIDGNGESRALRHGVIGRPYPFVELVLRDANGAPVAEGDTGEINRSEEAKSELHTLMRISYTVLCLQTKKH